MTTAPEEETILLMFSGGVDSTYLLYHYLRDTGHPVHAHHISVRYPHQKRWQGEDPASEKIVAWCRENVRDFEYSTSGFDLNFPRVGLDIDLQLLVASKVALNLGPKRVTVALGWCTDDLHHPRARARHERDVTATLWRALCQSVVGLGPSVVGLDLNEKVAKPILERGLSKADIVADLPKELVALTWSCRAPEFVDDIPRPCRNCHACRSRLMAMGEWLEFGG